MNAHAREVVQFELQLPTQVVADVETNVGLYERAVAESAGVTNTQVKAEVSPLDPLLARREARRL